MRLCTSIVVTSIRLVQNTYLGFSMGHIEPSHGHTSVNESDNIGDFGGCRSAINSKQLVSYIKQATSAEEQTSSLCC